GGAVRGAGGGAPAARRPEAGCTRASVARTAASDGRQLSAPEGRVPVVGFGHRTALVGVTTVASEKVRFGSNDDVALPRIGYAIMSPNGLAETRSDSRCLLSPAGATRRIAQIQLCRSTKSPPLAKNLSAGPAAGDCDLGDLRGRQKREAAQMKKLTIPALAFIVVQHTAFAFPVTEAGPSLGLGRGDSPTFAGSARFRQAVIARLFGSSTSFGFTPNTKISVDADSVVCRVSNVDITSRGCDLS